MRETIFVAASLALILLSGCGDSSTLETELSPEVLTEAQAIAPDKVYDLPELFFVSSRVRGQVCGVRDADPGFFCRGV